MSFISGVENFFDDKGQKIKIHFSRVTVLICLILFNQKYIVVSNLVFLSYITHYCYKYIHLTVYLKRNDVSNFNSPILVHTILLS